MRNALPSAQFEELGRKRRREGHHSRPTALRADSGNLGSLERGTGGTRTGAGKVHIYLKHADGLQWPCPECGVECALYDHQPERTWRHLDTCQYQTILHGEPPRANCREHGPRVARLPWAESGGRFTMLFERLIIDWLRLRARRLWPGPVLGRDPRGHGTGRGTWAVAPEGRTAVAYRR